jgi:hypothetical protein
MSQDTNTMPNRDPKLGAIHDPKKQEAVKQGATQPTSAANKPDLQSDRKAV